ncbi:MAG TPA: DNA starvation/stationary phase protection protein [Bryobacteraceae bacterium]|jgi:starvation-inducible DNA-binding protein|nr:DNA starvation/stationary phase protection protein [Bryobacteraceae bacterium]
MAKTGVQTLGGEKINIGLNDEQRAKIIEALNKVLADEHVLYIKTRNYHWNVTGPRFHDLHLFLEKQYEQVADIIDEVAENARQFGGFAFGTLREFIENSRLQEQPGTVPDADTMVNNLLQDHETLIQELRRDIDRAADELHAQDAADFLTGILEQHNKMAWMLRAFTQSR